MPEAIGVINEVILTKLKSQMIPTKQKVSILATAICCLALALASLIGRRYLYAAILAMGGFIFIGHFRATIDKYYKANLAEAKRNNKEVARYKIEFDETSLIIMTIDGKDPTEMPYRTFVRMVEIDEAIVLFNHQNQMVFISKEETDPEDLAEIREIIKKCCFNLNKRRKGDVL